MRRTWRSTSLTVSATSSDLLQIDGQFIRLRFTLSTCTAVSLNGVIDPVTKLHGY